MPKPVGGKVLSLYGLRGQRKRLKNSLRKHRRWQKATDRKQEIQEKTIQAQRNLQRDDLPNFYNIPIRKESAFGKPVCCPSCNRYQSFFHSFTCKKIDTKQGIKEVYICGYCGQRCR